MHRTTIIFTFNHVHVSNKYIHINKYTSMLCLCFFMLLYLCDKEKKVRYPLDPKMKYLGAKLFYIYNLAKI